MGVPSKRVPLATSPNSVGLSSSPAISCNTTVDCLVVRMPWKLLSMTEGLPSLRFLG